MNRNLRISTLLLYALLAACVTVNIYFPAAAAEKAADKIIQDIYGKKPKGEKEKPVEEPPAEEQPAPEESSGLPHLNDLTSLLNLLAPPAQAKQPDIDISTPGIKKLQAAMRGRHQALQPFYASGAVGMTSKGLLAVRDPGAVPLPDRNKVKQLVAQENQDRNALYAEIARENGHPEWEAQIRGTFAERWIANAPGGWWHQGGSGQWRQK
jgi:uncharacterized protein YdbL (DUF1318 family)